MKIQPITFRTVTQNSQFEPSSSTGSNIQFAKTVTNLNNIPAYRPVSFGGIQNSSKLRALFAYKLPCMYSGITLIDPKQYSRWQKSNLFAKPVGAVMKTLEPYADSFIDFEGRLFQILKERANVAPDKPIKLILDELKPVYCRRLRKKQTPVFYELNEIFKTLPDKYYSKFKALMIDTHKKLDEKPVYVPFSSYEFKYKLAKITNLIDNGTDVKAKKVMRKMNKEAKRFANTTSSSTIEHQKEVLKFLKVILRKSVLKNHEALNVLMDESKARLDKNEIVVSFSRKSFMYDLVKIIEDLKDDKIQAKIINTAQKLPTSKESFSAFMMKLMPATPDKIGHSLVWPSLASVEHILPRSCGGPDLMKNFGAASTRENSERKNIDFLSQIKRRPNTPLYCQKQVDRLAELYRQGVFYKIGLSPRYIRDFRDTIYEQSKHQVLLDVPALP